LLSPSHFSKIEEIYLLKLQIPKKPIMFYKAYRINYGILSPKGFFEASSGAPPEILQAEREVFHETSRTRRSTGA
jgi:hypothetical protein